MVCNAVGSCINPCNSATIARFGLLLLSSVALLCDAKYSNFSEWQPDPIDALVPNTVDELASRYNFSSVPDFESWLLETDDDIFANLKEADSLLDGRFVCDADKITQPQFGRVTRGGDLNFWGTNLGGFMVLEPWITPSMFYQFLGKENPLEIGMDMKTFCLALGEDEANIQLRRHWSTWVTEQDIKALSEAAVDTVRIPVGDWQFSGYEPYITCTQGANEELTRVLDLCLAYGINVILDMHAIKGSMNGLDNSGEAMDVIWSDNSHFTHWSTLNAKWIGKCNSTLNRYTSFDFENFQHSLTAFEGLVNMFGKHPAVVAFQPVNEPWVHTPPQAYQLFAWTAYNMVQMVDTNLGLIVHDSFRGSSLIFVDWMIGCKNVVTDTHLYTAWEGWWSGDLNEDYFVNEACSQAAFLSDGENRMPRIIGEYSLATDNCAMWLNGFNDNPIGYPQFVCDWVECAEPYMGPEQPGAPPDPSLPAQLPIGTGFSTPVYGKCPVDKSWEDDDATMTRLARAKLAAFSYTSGKFFWNFKTELEPKWSFIESFQRGWLPDMNKLQQDPNYLNQYLDGVCDEIWYSTGFKDRPTEPTSFWEKYARAIEMVLLAVIGCIASVYTFTKVNRQCILGYKTLNSGDFDCVPQKRVQSMPLFYSHAFQNSNSSQVHKNLGKLRLPQ